MLPHLPSRDDVLSIENFNVHCDLKISELFTQNHGGTLRGTSILMKRKY
jgi:hypothetical protein